MKRRTSIMNGSIISIGLLAGGSAVAMPMSSETWQEFPHGVHRSAAGGLNEVHSNEMRQGDRFSAASLKNSGSAISVVDIGRFSKADIASAIAAFYNGIFGNRNSGEAPTLIPVSMDPVDQTSIADSSRYANAAKPSTSVPEPAALALFGLGLAGIGFTTRARQKNGK